MSQTGRKTIKERGKERKKEMVGKEQETHEEKQQKTCGGVEELVFICKRRPYRELQKAISVISNGALQQFSLTQMSTAAVVSHSQ